MLRFLVLALALTTPVKEECRRLEAAHRALLDGSFTCERHFTVALNGDLKVREVARLTYRDGELTREILDREVLDRNIVLEEGEGETALEVPFDCRRLAWVDEQTVELSSSDETETVFFVWEREAGALRPLRWSNTESKRLLWKKLTIEAEAEYRKFAWQ